MTTLYLSIYRKFSS